MKSYVALLRGINVGPHKQVDMGELRNLITKLGFVDARSMLRTGNLLFQCPSRTCAQLERLLEVEAQKHLELETKFFVRTAEEWRSVIDRNPFRAEAKRDPSHLLVMFLKDEVAAKDMKALQDSIAGREVVRADGRHAYVIYPDGIGRSRLTHAVIEKKLGTAGTGRNWNTVLKLGTLANV
jgi:uncharacterized protein (DUF1697 family)